MKCLFAYNPNSGKGRILKYKDYIEKKLQEKFSIVDIYETKSGSDTMRIAKESCSKYDVLVFSGGDGTFNDIITGIAQEEKRPILGYIPSGTVNDIARNLGIKKNIDKALDNVLDGDILKHDVGRVNDRYFMYVLGCGTFTSTSYQTNQILKKIFGRFAYLFSALKDLFKPPINDYEIEVDGKIIKSRSPLVLIVNSRTVGGILFNRNGHNNDGKFEVVLVRYGLFRGFWNIMRLFIGGLKPHKKNIYYAKGATINVTTKKPSAWTIDGEQGPTGNLEIENLNSHVQIYVPKK